jgi:hypothetical protein
MIYASSKSDLSEILSLSDSDRISLLSDSETLILNLMPEIYHALSRGVDKRKIFMDDKDRFRFIHDLFEFNDQAPAENLSYNLRKPSIAVGQR